MNPTYHNQKYKPQALHERIKSSDNFIPYFVIAESHLSEDVFDAEITIPEYNIYRADRIERKNGGTAIYVHEKIVIDTKDVYSDSVCESMMLKNNHLNLILISVYKPPEGPDLDISFKKCIESIETFIEKHNNKSEIIVMGDFNLPNILWETRQIKKSRSTKEKQCAKYLLNFTDNHFLIQQVHQPTRKDRNILDLVFSNNDESIHEISVERTNMSDHDFVNITCINSFAANNSDVEADERNPFDKLNFFKANWTRINEDLAQIEWDSILTNNQSVDEAVEVLESKIIKVLQDHTPIKETKVPGKVRKIPRKRNILIRKCRRINSKINTIKKNSPSQSNTKITKLLQEKSNLEDQIKQSIENESSDKEKSIISKIKTNPKALYSYAKCKSRVKSKIGPLSDGDGKLQSDAAVMSNLLQDQYLKVFSNPSEKTKINIEVNDKNTCITDIDFTIQDIENAIKLIPTNSASGPDKFPAIVLKKCSKSLSKALNVIWRKSLNSGQIPIKYLHQTIIPIFKKGSKADPSNYRPVSLTSHIIKIFERIIRSKLIQYIERNGFITPHQHGFCTGKSCLTQLLNHLEELLNILENNSNADVLYLDFAKAFDKVDHAILLQKLKSIGIEGKVHLWLQNFLSNRKQSVLVNGAKSREETVKSGVPQGTVLGPLLFIIYINDITQVINHSSIKIFADDSKLIKSIQSFEDKKLMDNDIKSVMEWAKNNKMELNKAKFQLLQHGNKSELKTPYKIDENIEIEKSQHVKDLGVTLSESLSFDQHITNITKEAKKHASWIFRLFDSRDPETILLLYNTYVRPRLEYSSPLWSPFQKRHLIQIESIQRTVTSRIAGMESLNYWERIQQLKIPSLQRRRERFQIIHIWKISKGIIPNDLNLQFYQTSRFGMKCKIPKYNPRQRHLSTIKTESFFSKGPALYNIIPEKIKSSQSLNSFKSNLQKFLDKIPDNPPLPNYVARNNNSLLEWVTGSNHMTVGVDDEEPLTPDGDRSQMDVAIGGLVQ